MRLVRITLLAFLVAGPGLPLAAAAEKADYSWEKLKSLVGDWEGTYEGQPSRVSYRLVSNGTAVMETMEAPDSSQMVSLYHPDGSSLLMTHYCSMGTSRGCARRACRTGGSTSPMSTPRTSGRRKTTG